jgi:hypothetical protein
MKMYLILISGFRGHHTQMFNQNTPQVLGYPASSEVAIP